MEPRIRSEKAIWLTIILVEIVSVILTRLIVSRYGTYSVDGELLRSFWRLVAVAFYWAVFRHIVISQKLTSRQVAHPIFLFSLILFLCVPLLVGYMGQMDGATKSVFAATSVVVALREEITFRGLVQNLLARHMSPAAAIGTTTLLFTAWHVGVVPLEVFAYAQVAIASVLLGVIYARTRNLPLVVGLHALYDALWSLTPILDRPIMPYRYGIALLCLSLGGVVWWGWRTVSPDPARHTDAPRSGAPVG